jgi:hypothetical protein
MPTVRGVTFDASSLGSNHLATRLGDRLRGRDPRVCGRDDLVAGPHAQRVHGDVQRVRAVGARHAVRRADGPGELFLETLDERSADEGRGADHLCNRSIQRRLYRQVLRMQVRKGNGRLVGRHVAIWVLEEGSVRRRRAGLPA